MDTAEKINSLTPEETNKNLNADEKQRSETSRPSNFLCTESIKNKQFNLRKN